MSDKTSRIILVVEAVLIGLPFTGLALLVTGMRISEVIEFPSLLDVFVNGLLAIISMLAIGSGWWLFLRFIRDGSKALRQTQAAWWALASIGALILVTSLGSSLLPSSPKYSDWAMFREDFNILAYALPLLIPLGHLAAERLFRASPGRLESKGGT